MDILGKNPQCDVTFCDAVFIDETGRADGRRFSDQYPVPEFCGGRLFEKLIFFNFINMQTTLMRRECVARSGYFDEDIKWVEDWWYWVKISRQHRFCYSPETLAKYRVHARSSGVVQKRGQAVNRFKVFRRILRLGDLPLRHQARLFYNMGLELRMLGKRRASGRLFRAAAAAAITDVRAFNILGKAVVRSMLCAKKIPSLPSTPAAPDLIEAAKN
jgi:hypothetical protein